MRWLRSLFGASRREHPQILVLIDFENLLLSLPATASIPQKFSIETAFHQAIKEITGDIGEILHIFIFVPPHQANIWGTLLHQEGFTIVFCPKIQNKEGEDIDTVDSSLIDFGKKIVASARKLDITHLCLGSGDKDFTPLVQEAIRRGLKIIVLASSEKSLSYELKRLADKVYRFSPTEN